MRPGLLFGLLCLLLGALAESHAAATRKIVLVGGSKSEGAARHDYPSGVRLLKTLLESSPDAKALRVEAYPDGWPADPAALDGASTLVWYFDGLDKHPLLDAEHRRRFDAAMKQGIGLVVLHQASTVPLHDDLGLPPALGAVRAGMFDRTTESARLAPVSTRHPVNRGVHAFSYRDEFYPTLRLNRGGGKFVPLLQATLHVQYRDGAQVVEDLPEATTVAWAFERNHGGRSFGFTGAHYLVTLDQPMARRMLLNAIFWTAGMDVPADGVRSGQPDATSHIAQAALRAEPAKPAAPSYPDVTTFHHDAQRSGWFSAEQRLTPTAVTGPSFGLLWESPQLDAFEGAPARLYASPLYVDRVEITAGPHRGESFPVVFAASSNGYVYAINAAHRGDVAAGRILWRRQLAPPCRLQPAPLDGVPTGVLSTPMIDRARKRLYVTSCDPVKRWQAYALDLGSGEVLPGWPVTLDEATFNAVNRNAGPELVPPRRRFDFRVQRGALNLSPDGSRLYVVFGESETGWLASVDTLAAKVHSAFAAVAMPHRGSGGIWGAGGPAVDADGRVFVVTGSGYEGYVDRPGDWTQSVLELADSAGAGLRLRGTYTPFNYCQTATQDIDLGSGGAMLLPDIDPATTTTPRLLAVGGKQGNLYLLQRGQLPGALDRRQACSTDAASDLSLLAPETQLQFGTRGPLNVFGPYSEHDGSMDQARARSLPAYYRGADGAHYLYATGNTRLAEGSSVGMPPSLVRLRVVTAPGEPAYLRVDQQEQTLTFGNPGSPIVSSHGSHDAIVWVLDENAGRSALLSGDDAPQPVLYALDAMTLELLWKSAPGQLPTSGKYNEATIARDLVFVGTDRIQAFGLGQPDPTLPRRSPKTAPAKSSIAPAAAIGPLLDASDGQAIYAARCAVCHDHPQGNIPPRARIAARSRAEIVHTLTHGAMRAQAAGLRTEQIDAVSRYLKP